ncbi:hypothetical protein CCR75_009720 [Bremia lactucae]|uniref:Uncharacterized protein n=1 Tax=Bremia lactucae TaxID=4779 RepID=A0A976FMM6_BRELC|nr:hypothetical protein CCR75_009720 [Bremia lactucae]
MSINFSRCGACGKVSDFTGRPIPKASPIDKGDELHIVEKALQCRQRNRQVKCLVNGTISPYSIVPGSANAPFAKTCMEATSP